jgi:DNA-binding transcriptional MerR regulator
MDGLTIHEAASTTGWSARMLRYVEREGLIAPRRSDGGFRLYGPGELQRLRTLRELLDEHELNLGDVGFALRLRRDPELRAGVEGWLEARARRPEDVPADEWLSFEQTKHERLLAAAAPATTTTT